MANQVYLEKRLLRSQRRNGQRNYRWSLRWWDPGSGSFKCESTGTADRTLADTMRKTKWAELNIAGAAPPEPEPVEPAAAMPTWQDCRDAMQRALEADNLRPTYINDCLLTLEGLRRMFPEVSSPAEISPELANEYKRRRAEAIPAPSPWSIKGDLATLKAIFGKWLGRECGLLKSNPFADVKAPRCDDPDVRIVSAAETEALFRWLADRWNGWRLPLIYLQAAGILGWRATEIASLRTEDLLADGYVRVGSESSKTRRHKFGRLPGELHDQLRACSADGYAFGRFSDELRRLLMLWKRKPHHAAKVRDFAPERLVGWMQDELQRFNDANQAAENKAALEQCRKPDALPTFTLHDFRRTAITGMQMAGVSEKEASIQVGCTPEVMRRHYERLDGMAIAGRNLERRLGQSPQLLRACYARDENGSLDDLANRTQTVAG